ncbi:MAG TPA: hypothetical protein V6C76_15255 [Drouetiella sp.]
MIHFDFQLEPADAEVTKDIGSWTYEIFMLNVDARIEISSEAGVWKFSVPVMNFVNTLMVAANNLSDSHKSVEFRDWDNPFDFLFVYDNGKVVAEHREELKFSAPINEFRDAALQLAPRVKQELETTYPALLNNAAFQKFF